MQLCDPKKAVFIACQTRAGDLENFFAHENHPFPVSLSEYGSLSTHSKSDFINCLKALSEPQYEPQTVHALVVDGGGGGGGSHEPPRAIGLKPLGDIAAVNLLQRLHQWQGMLHNLMSTKTRMKQDTRDSCAEMEYGYLFEKKTHTT